MGGVAVERRARVGGPDVRVARVVDDQRLVQILAGDRRRARATAVPVHGAFAGHESRPWRRLPDVEVLDVGGRRRIRITDERRRYLVAARGRDQRDGDVHLAAAVRRAALRRLAEAHRDELPGDRVAAAGQRRGDRGVAPKVPSLSPPRATGPARASRPGSRPGSRRPSCRSGSRGRSR